MPRIKPMDPLSELPPIDIPMAHSELGFALETWQRVFDVAPVLPFRRLSLRGFIDSGASVQIGHRQPMPDDPDHEHYRLDVAAIMVPRSEAFQVAERMSKAAGSGAQCLVTTHGAKDFAYLFETGWIPASEMVTGGEVLVVFPGGSCEPLLWARQTNAANAGMGTAEIVERLRCLEADHGTKVVGAGWDWVQIELEPEPGNRQALAAELIDFCFDLAEEYGPDEDLDDDEEHDFEDCARVSDDVSAAALKVGIVRGMAILSEVADAIFDGTEASTEPLTPDDFGGDANLMREVLEKLGEAPENARGAEELFVLLGQHADTIDPARLVAALGKDAFQWMFENVDESLASASAGRDGEDEDDDELERLAAKALAEHLETNRSLFLWWD